MKEITVLAPVIAAISPAAATASVSVEKSGVQLFRAVEVSDAQEGANHLFDVDSGIVAHVPPELVAEAAPNKVGQ